MGGGSRSRSRSPRERRRDRSRDRDRESRRRRSRSRSHDRDRRDRDRDVKREVKREGDGEPRKYKYWDVPPLGYEHMQPREYKELQASGQIPRATIQSSVPVIFISGLPSYLTAEQVKELLSSFGQLKAFNLVTDAQTGMSKGYAFCEYLDTTLTDQAIAGLNGMQLGDNKLLVQLSNTNSRHTHNNQFGFGASGIDLSKGTGPATEVLCLLNMITEDDLRDDEEFEDIKEDIKTECSKYGTVISLEIPRPVPGHEIKGVGKVFVEFSSPSECQKAQAALTGRKFANRVVVTSYYDLNQYHCREFGN
ncbi:Splicing factor U2AF subunit [Aphelenchoides fujianensis]|nr:Splicing factor U2AF subunit [Aphelenchoides fujianensis]